MPDITQAAPVPVITEAQKIREAADRAEGRDFRSGMIGALQGLPESYAVRQFALSGYQPDPGFEGLDGRQFKEFSDGVDTELLPRFAEAVSLEHAMAIRGQLLIMSDHRRDLAALGYTGQALSLAANVVDPATLAVGLLSGGAGAVMTAGMESRLGALAAKGLITGGSFTGLEAYKASQDPTVTGADVAGAGLAGFGMQFAGGLTRGRFAGAMAAGAGGAVGAGAVDAASNPFREEDQRRSILWSGATNFILGGLLHLGGSYAQGGEPPLAGWEPADVGSRMTAAVDGAARRMMRDVEYQAAIADGATITPGGRAYFREQLDPAARAMPLVTPTLDEMRAAELDRTTAARSALWDWGQRQNMTRAEAERASAVARTPLDFGGGIGFLPPIVHPNQVTGWHAESPHARLSFEDARRDANLARRANPGTPIAVVEYPGGAFAAFRERTTGEAKGAGPDIAPPPAGAGLAGRRTAASTPEPSAPRVVIDQNTAWGAVPPTPEQAKRIGQLYDYAHTAYPTFVGDLRVAAADVGGTLVVGPVKDPARVLEKANHDYEGDVGRVKDLLRATITVDSVEDLPRAVVALARKYEVVSVKDRFAAPLASGYRDVLVNVRLPGGGIGEVQFTLPELLAVKDQQHSNYEKARSTYRADPAKVAEINAEASLAYDAALAAARRRAASAKKAASEIGDATSETSLWRLRSDVPSSESTYGASQPTGLTTKAPSESKYSAPSGNEAGSGTSTNVSAIDGPPGTSVAFRSPEAQLAAIIARRDPVTNPRGMGAADPSVAHRIPSAPNKRFDDLDLSHANDAPASYRKVRWDMPAAVSDSPVQDFRLVANMLGKDPLPKSDGSPSLYTAPEWVSDRTAATKGVLVTRMDAIYGDYTKAAGERAMSRVDFGAAATKAWRRLGTATTVDPNTARAAELASSLVTEAYGRAHSHGVQGFETATSAKDYVPRLWRQDLMDAARDKYGMDALRQLIGGAILRGEWNVTPTQADAMARAVIRNGGKTANTSGVQRGRFFVDDPEVLKEALRDAVPDISDAAVSDILHAVKPASESGATPTRAKRRIDLDETYSIETPAGRLGVEDLLENNLESLVLNYAHQLHGAAAMAEVWRNLARSPDDRITSLDGMLRRLERTAQDYGVKNYAKDLKKIEVMAKITAGIPLEDDSAVNRALRSLSNLNFVHYMSNLGTGAQNFAEITHGMSEAGLTAAVRQMPALGEIFARAKSGELDNHLLREMELLGIGLDRINHRITPRSMGEEGVMQATGKIEHITARAARLAGDVSLQSYGQVVLSRWGAACMAQKWMGIATSGKQLGEKRLAGLGMRPEMAVRVTAAMKQHATTETGVTGVKLKQLNLPAWKDVEAAMAFRNAISKYTRRVALTTNATEGALWMTKPAGRLFVQLRKFVFGAWTSKLLHEVYMRDTVAARSFMLSLAGAALVYVGRSYVESVGNADDSYLDKRINATAISTAAFGRSAFTSFLPGIVDTAADWSGSGTQVFGHARTTGLSGSFVFGNPTVDWGRAVYQMPQAILGPILWDDYGFSRQDVRNLANGTWIPNFLGVRNIIDQLSSDLPKQSRNQQ